MPALTCQRSRADGISPFCTSFLFYYNIFSHLSTNYVKFCGLFSKMLSIVFDIQMCYHLHSKMYFARQKTLTKSQFASVYFIIFFDMIRFMSSACLMHRDGKIVRKNRLRCLISMLYIVCRILPSSSLLPINSHVKFYMLLIKISREFKL